MLIQIFKGCMLHYIIIILNVPITGDSDFINTFTSLHTQFCCLHRFFIIFLQFAFIGSNNCVPILSGNFFMISQNRRWRTVDVRHDLISCCTYNKSEMKMCSEKLMILGQIGQIECFYYSYS